MKIEQINNCSGNQLCIKVEEIDMVRICFRTEILQNHEFSLNSAVVKIQLVTIANYL